MKLTNKILLVFLILLVLLVTTYKIVFNSKVELIPNPFGEKDSYITKSVPVTSNNLRNFDLSGRFIVYFKQRDTSRIMIEGPDNLINHYLSIKQSGNRISIISKIDLSKYFHYLRIYFFVKNLRSVKASDGAVVSLDKFIGDSLDVETKDSSVVRADYIKYLNANLKEKDKSMIMLWKTINATIHLYDNSNLLLTLDGGDIAGTIENNTDFGLDGIIKRNNVIKMKSDSNLKGEEK